MQLPFHNDVDLDNLGYADVAARDKWRALRTLIEYERNPERAFIFLARTLHTVTGCSVSTLFHNHPEGDYLYRKHASREVLLKIIYAQLLKLKQDGTPPHNTWGIEAQGVIGKLDNIQNTRTLINALQGTRSKLVIGANIFLALVIIAFLILINTPVDASLSASIIGGGVGAWVISRIALYCIYTNRILELDGSIYKAYRNLIPVNQQGEQEENELQNIQEERVDSKLSLDERAQQVVVVESKHDARENIAANVDSKRAPVAPRSLDATTKKLNALLAAVRNIKHANVDNIPCCQACGIPPEGNAIPNDDLIVFHIPQTIDGQPDSYSPLYHQSCIIERLAGNGIIEGHNGRPIPLVIKISSRGTFIIELETAVTWSSALATYEGALPNDESVLAPSIPLPTASAAARLALIPSAVSENKRQQRQPAEVSLVRRDEPVEGVMSEVKGDEDVLSPAVINLANPVLQQAPENSPPGLELAANVVPEEIVAASVSSSSAVAESQPEAEVDVVVEQPTISRRRIVLSS